MSVRDCITDMIAQHDSCESEKPFLGQQNIYEDIRYCMVHFCDSPSYFDEVLLPFRISQEDLDAPEFSLSQWKSWMTIFFEVTIRFRVSFPSDENFSWEIEKLPEVTETTPQHQVAVPLREILTPFDSFISSIRDFWGTAPRPGATHSSVSRNDFVKGPIWRVTGVLMWTVHIADFYYRFHFLQRIRKSSTNLSKVLGWSDRHLQRLIDALMLDGERYEKTRIYAKYREHRVYFQYHLARKRGIVPTSFFITDITRTGDQPVGGGQYADMWKGYMTIPADENADSQQVVALKVLKEFNLSRKLQPDSLRALYQESVLWQKIDHPNVLRFIGPCQVDDERFQTRIGLVSPWMKNGNILAYVGNHKSANRQNLLRQVAKGLIHLHSHRIIHGDLKCANVLVSDDGTAMLADFGLSKGVNMSSNPNASDNVRWLAPELMFPEKFRGSGKRTRESDVYAFGMTALELFTGEEPFINLLPDPAEVSFEVAINGLRPVRPVPVSGVGVEARGLTDSIWKLIEECWDRDPLSRPRTDSVNSDLVDFSNEVRVVVNGWSFAAVER
ncbi:kinase-like protein [Schizopora paradoxa]|uniref:Kinase-like protein n=1 Tax=Schizopora paradoxa TaxID=27342 RepID=A0A0H2RAM1_9AGAM|nr:kinase-like protein [Schizopora paradoxa]